jgi:hypothetical protein
VRSFCVLELLLKPMPFLHHFDVGVFFFFPLGMKVFAQHTYSCVCIKSCVDWLFIVNKCYTSSCDWIGIFEKIVWKLNICMIVFTLVPNCEGKETHVDEWLHLALQQAKPPISHTKLRCPLTFWQKGEQTLVHVNATQATLTFLLILTSCFPQPISSNT